MTEERLQNHLAEVLASFSGWGDGYLEARMVVGVMVREMGMLGWQLVPPQEDVLALRDAKFSLGVITPFLVK